MDHRRARQAAATAELRLGRPLSFSTTVEESRTRFDKQIADLADTIIAVGTSDVLTTKLRELERQKRVLAQMAPTVPALTTGAADQWRELVANRENLGTYARPDEMEIARTIIHDYIGEVSVVEDARGVYGLVRMSNGAGYESGAQESAPKLHPLRFVLA